MRGSLGQVDAAVRGLDANALANGPTKSGAILSSAIPLTGSEYRKTRERRRLADFARKLVRDRPLWSLAG